MNLRRIGIRLGIALLIVLLGLIAGSIFISRESETEPPPCPACSAVYASAASEVPTVTPCDLVHDPKRYNDQVVRVRAIWRHDSGTVSLSDPAAQCEGGSPMKAGLPESFASCDGARQMLVIHTGLGFERGYNGRANVIVAGRYGRVQSGDGSDAETGLTILCVERVTPIGSEIRGRIRYAMEEVSRRIGFY
jgi:hypothetical protein